MKNLFQNALPVEGVPLIHAITNGITNEFVANSLLAIGAKPIMTEDVRELETVVKSAQALFLNLGQMTFEKEKSIRQAANLAQQFKTPMVVDAVGITQLSNRLKLVQDLLTLSPHVVKGNISEMRALLGLGSKAKGVDICQAEQEKSALTIFEEKMRDFSEKYPKTCFLATGKIDCVAFQGKIWWLSNGVSTLDQITGTGDVVGALIAGLLASQITGLKACLQGVTYFNLCGEKAFLKYPKALASFKQELLDQLGYFYTEEEWHLKAKIGEG